MKYRQDFDIRAEEPADELFCCWNGERNVCKPRAGERKYTDKQFRRHLLLFVAFGIGMYAAVVIALSAFGVA